MAGLRVPGRGKGVRRLRGVRPRPGLRPRTRLRNRMACRPGHGDAPPTSSTTRKSAEAQAEPISGETLGGVDSAEELAPLVWQELVLATRGEALRIVRGAEDENGFEAWRLLARRARGGGLSRRRALLNVLLKWKFPTATVTDQLDVTCGLEQRGRPTATAYCPRRSAPSLLLSSTSPS